MARLSEMARNTRRQDALAETVHGDLTVFKEQITQAAPGDVLRNLIWKRREKMRQAREAGMIGIPCFVREDGSITLEAADVLNEAGLGC